MEKKIREEEDFINAPKFGNSINKLLAKTDKVLENHTVGKLLLLSEKEVEDLYEESIAEIRKVLISDGEIED